jgi:NAD-specific glutamate dehydrogenase
MNQQAIIDRPDREDRAARARIDAAAKLLRGGKSDVADDFVALLFGRAAPEDLVGYEAAELAALAREAWAFVATASRHRRKSVSSSPRPPTASTSSRSR